MTYVNHEYVANPDLPIVRRVVLCAMRHAISINPGAHSRDEHFANPSGFSHGVSLRGPDGSYMHIDYTGSHKKRTEENPDEASEWAALTVQFVSMPEIETYRAPDAKQGTPLIHIAMFGGAILANNVIKAPASASPALPAGRTVTIYPYAGVHSGSEGFGDLFSLMNPYWDARREAAAKALEEDAMNQRGVARAVMSAEEAEADATLRASTKLAAKILGFLDTWAEQHGLPRSEDLDYTGLQW